jgi:hypothetical protein
MSISPPSDIILDVARAADPVREQRATARLSRMATAASESFDSFLDAGGSDPVTAKSASPTNPGPASQLPATQVTNAPSGPAKAFLGFEAMALANMIESAMPDESSSVFGSGTAGHVWKSMLAEQLGRQMAEAGGIGIARQLASDARFGEPGQTDTSSIAKSLLVAQIERGFVDAAMPGADGPDEELSS